MIAKCQLTFLRYFFRFTDGGSNFGFVYIYLIAFYSEKYLHFTPGKVEL